MCITQTNRFNMYLVVLFATPISYFLFPLQCNNRVRLTVLPHHQTVIRSSADIRIFDLFLVTVVVVVQRRNKGIRQQWAVSNFFGANSNVSRWRPSPTERWMGFCVKKGKEEQGQADGGGQGYEKMSTRWRREGEGLKTVGVQGSWARRIGCYEGIFFESKITSLALKKLPWRHMGVIGEV